jgi:hypothetical protein
MLFMCVQVNQMHTKLSRRIVFDGFWLSDLRKRATEEYGRFFGNAQTPGDDDIRGILPSLMARTDVWGEDTLGFVPLRFFDEVPDWVFKEFPDVRDLKVKQGPIRTISPQAYLRSPVYKPY